MKVTTAELSEQLQRWNEQDEYQKIIDTIEALSPEESTPDLISQLARAYNNLAGPEDSHLFQKAVDLLLSVEEHFPMDHNWNYRIAYAYYYLDKEFLALPYFQKALEARPGDCDTEEFIQNCQNQLTLPLSLTPFQLRVSQCWKAFIHQEEQLRKMIDEKKQSQPLVELCSEILRPAFEESSFELGFNGKKYELILSADGDAAEIFKLLYFKNNAPEVVFEKWNILIGRQPVISLDSDETKSLFNLRMYGVELNLLDGQVWLEPLENSRFGFSIYCEKLLPLLRSNENQAYGVMAVLLDQAIGEIAAIRHVGYLDLLTEPSEGQPIVMTELLSHMASALEKQPTQLFCADNWAESYSLYELTPTAEEDWILRQDIYIGSTCCPSLINSYYNDDDDIMNRFHCDGAVPGFFYYPLQGLERSELLDLRDKLVATIESAAGEAFLFMGGATGECYGYIDFIAWNLRDVLNAAVDAFQDSPVSQACFHSFRQSADTIVLKGEC